MTRIESKQELGLTGKKGRGHAGLVHRDQRLSSGFGALGSETVLVLAGEARLGDPAQLDYRKKLLDLVDKSRCKGKIELLLGNFQPDE